ncbi:MAG: thymidine phosphorylase [Alphaproteobacteria bacterium]
MLPQEVIRRKRDGAELSEKEIGFMVAGLADGSLSEGQIAAFAMAVFFRGMTMQERVYMTRSMVDSGDTLTWDDLDLDGPVLDKHSTGGVGDKVSLIVAPIVAACGGYVPMISGRGLGHTGGTLDKLDSIPGYETSPDSDQFRRVVRKAGCAIIGQTAELAPADRRFYAVRDVTATVESIPLITASILSKKLAAGLGGLVMDVKTGTGAFATDYSMARELAQSIVSVANRAGMPTVAMITDMNQVLGHTVGNALEVGEAIDFLTGKQQDSRLLDLTTQLSAEMLVLGKIAESPQGGVEKARDALQSGAAAERFSRMVAALGGPADIVNDSDGVFDDAPVVRPVFPSRTGKVTGVDARLVGLAVVELGGGRKRIDDAIDTRVGFSRFCAIGEETSPDEPLAFVHAATEAQAEAASTVITKAIKIGAGVEPGPIVYERLYDDAD